MGQHHVGDPSGAWRHDGHLPARVVCAVGALDSVADECARLDLRAVLVIASASARQHAARVATALGPRHAGTLDQVVQHVPESLVARAVARAQELRADGVLTLGGGSATGLGKALGLRAGLPLIAVPTTYAGSEMTPVYGITGPTGKQTGTSPAVVPRVVVYDPALVASLPPDLTAASGMNAMAHCVHALWGQRSTPFARAYAEQGLRELAASLPVAVDSPDDLQARSQTLVGACMAGAALAAAGTGLHHRICHVLGGSYGMPHSAVHSAVLPQVVAANAAHGPDAPQVRSALEALGRCLGSASGDAAAALFDLTAAIGAPTRLADLGLARDDLPAVVAAVTRTPADNPVDLSPETLLATLHAAWSGKRPGGPR